MLLHLTDELQLAGGGVGVNRDGVVDLGQLPRGEADVDDGTEDLPTLLDRNFALDMERQGITGHSMGGHGALTMAMAHPDRYRSVSAFAPIANPTASDWGRKQLAAYLGSDEGLWSPHDATLCMRSKGFDGPILIDQGASDQFLDLLKPEALADMMARRRQSGQVRMQRGYDHSYFFISSFIEEHVAFHADALYGAR